MKHSHSHTGAKSIDEYAYLSHLKNVNGGLKLGFTIAVILLSVSATNWVVPIVATLMCTVITVVFGKVHLKDYLSLFTVPLVFLAMGALAIAMSLNFENGFSIAFHRSDVVHAMMVSVKALGAVSAMYTLSLSTPMNEIITILGKLRLPEILCELMRLMYKYIFILADSQVKMQNSATSRLGYVGFTRSFKTFGMVCSNLLVVSLRRATDYYNAVESRSFNGRLKFLSTSHPLKFSHVLGFGGVCVLLLCLEIVL
jgi:cobalt/nickel transport system permease protein